MKFNDVCCLVNDLWYGLNTAGKIVLFPIVAALAIVTGLIAIISMVIEYCFFKK